MKIKELEFFNIKFIHTEEQFCMNPKEKLITVNNILQFKDELQFCETFIIKMNKIIKDYE